MHRPTLKKTVYISFIHANRLAAEQNQKSSHCPVRNLESCQQHYQATACYSNFQESSIGAVRRCDASCRGTAPWLAWEHRFAPAPPSIVEQARREFHKRQVCRETSKNFRCKKKNCSFPAKTGFPLFSQRTLFEMLPTNHRHQHPIIQRQGHVNQGIVRHHTQDNSLCCLFVEPGNCTEWQTEKTITSLQWLRPNPRTVLHSSQPSMKDAPLDPLDQKKNAMSCFTHLQHFEMFGKSTWSNLKQFELFEFRRGTLMQGPVVATASPSSQPRRTPQWRGGSRAARTSPPGTLPARTSCPSSPSRHPPCSWRCPHKTEKHQKQDTCGCHFCHVMSVISVWPSLELVVTRSKWNKTTKSLQVLRQDFLISQQLPPNLPSFLSNPYHGSHHQKVC